MAVKIIASNKKAFFDYFLESKYETGIVLMGSEIKSIRAGNVNIKDSFVQIRNNEAYIVNMHISAYDKANIFAPETTRTRKLLLSKKEILKLDLAVKEKGYTLVATKIYLKNQYAKLEIALAKGKKKYDKREVEKQRTIKKDINKALKEFNK